MNQKPQVMYLTDVLCERMNAKVVSGMFFILDAATHPAHCQSSPPPRPPALCPR